MGICKFGTPGLFGLKFSSCSFIYKPVDFPSLKAKIAKKNLKIHSFESQEDSEYHQEEEDNKIKDIESKNSATLQKVKRS